MRVRNLLSSSSSFNKSPIANNSSANVKIYKLSNNSPTADHYHDSDAPVFASRENYIFVRVENPIIRSERAFHRGEAAHRNGNDPERCEVSPGCRSGSGRSCLLSGGESRDVEASECIMVPARERRRRRRRIGRWR